MDDGREGGERAASRVQESLAVDPVLVDLRERLGLADEDFPERFLRMPVWMRIQHVVLVICFLTLVFTGLPLVFPEARIVKFFFFAPFVWTLRGIVHRVAGLGLMGVSFFHIGYLIFSRQGNRDMRLMIPGPKDGWDALATFLYNLGIMQWLKNRGVGARFFERHPKWLFDHHPRFHKYNFVEKFEYLAVTWGNFVMVVTGFMLWFQEAALALFPKSAFDIVIVVHGFEAILAFLAIIIWHMYNVHINPEVFPMSRVWIDGQISLEEMAKHHPLELEGWMKEKAAEKERGLATGLLGRVREAGLDPARLSVERLRSLRSAGAAGVGEGADPPSPREEAAP